MPDAIVHIRINSMRTLESDCRSAQMSADLLSGIIQLEETLIPPQRLLLTTESSSELQIVDQTHKGCVDRLDNWLLINQKCRQRSHPLHGLTHSLR